MNTRPAATQCTVTCSHVLALIDALIYTVASADYEPLVDGDEHYQSLVSNQIEAAFALAEEVGLDLWAERAAPVGREETPMAILLRDADAAYGLPKCCAVPACDANPVRCSPRPSHLGAGTRWPSCPEMCVRHSAARQRILTRRVRNERPTHRGSIDAALMPLPAVASLAPSPEDLRKFEVGN